MPPAGGGSLPLRHGHEATRPRARAGLASHGTGSFGCTEGDARTLSGAHRRVVLTTAASARRFNAQTAPRGHAGTSVGAVAASTAALCGRYERGLFQLDEPISCEPATIPPRARHDLATSRPARHRCPLPSLPSVAGTLCPRSPTLSCCSLVAASRRRGARSPSATYSRTRRGSRTATATPSSTSDTRHLAVTSP